MDEKEKDRRIKELGMHIIRYTFDHGYGIDELVSAMESIAESLASYVVLASIIGEEGVERIAEAMQKAEAEDAIREAQDILEKGE